MKNLFQMGSNEGSSQCEKDLWSPPDYSLKVWQYTIVDVPDNWISIDDIPDLIKLIDSEIPCASVASKLSSYESPYPSTIGHEASFMRGHLKNILEKNS